MMVSNEIYRYLAPIPNRTNVINMHVKAIAVDMFSQHI